MESVEQLRRMIREIPPGRIVTLGVSRDGQPMTLKAQLADRKKTFGMGIQWQSIQFRDARDAACPRCRLCPPCRQCLISMCPVSVVVVHSSTRSGLMVENLTAQLGDYFGARTARESWCVQWKKAVAPRRQGSGPET